jgi:hypothetical protein
MNKSLLDTDILCETWETHLQIRIGQTGFAHDGSLGTRP